MKKTAGARVGRLGAWAIPAAVAGCAVALTFAAFGSGLSGGFVSDDVNCIVENEHVVGPIDPLAIFSQFSWWSGGRSDSPGYRPLVTLSFALNHAAAGLSPFGYHLTNFVLHAVTVCLLFAVARALQIGVTGAAIAALIFCVLPIHSEAVLWAVGRAELGAAIGFLLAVWMVATYRRSGRPALLAGAAAALLGGALCKENALTALAAPLLLGLAMPLDRAPVAKPAEPAAGRGRRAAGLRRDLWATAALAAAAACYLALRLVASGPSLPGRAESTLDNPLAGLEPGRRLLGAASVLGRYLWLSLAGHPLSIDYSYDALGIHEGFAGDRYVLVALAAVTVIAVAAWRSRRSAPALAAGALLAAASFSIVSNTVYVIGTIAGERLFYLPTAGLCLAAGTVIGPLLDAGGLRRTLATVMLALVCVVWIAEDRQRATQWQTPIRLFEATVSVVPNSARAQMELASAYGRAGRLDEAAPHFERALAIRPDYASAAYNFANALARARRYDDAVAQYRRTLQIDARFTRAWYNLAAVYRLQGRTEEWLEALRGTIRSVPRDPQARLEYADALLSLGRNQQAITAYDEAINLGADSPVAYFNRAVAKHRLGGCAAAADDYVKAASRPAPPPPVLRAAKDCLRQLGRTTEAEALGQDGKVANRDTRR